MSATKVDLYVSQLIEDLNNGLSWLKADDLGFGNIQEKYGANEIQIKTIQKHPKLIGLEPSVTIFNVIDDLKETNKIEEAAISRTEPTTAPAKQPELKGSDEGISKPVVPMDTRVPKVALPIPDAISNTTVNKSGSITEDDGSAEAALFNL